MRWCAHASALNSAGRVKLSKKYSAGTCLLELAFDPLLALVVLAVRAVAMAARMWHQRLMLAFAAFDLHLWAGLRAAVFHRREGLSVHGAELGSVLREELRLEGVDGRSEADHLTIPQAMVNPSIRALMRSMAWCLVWSVRWV